MHCVFVFVFCVFHLHMTDEMLAYVLGCNRAPALLVCAALPRDTPLAVGQLLLITKPGEDGGGGRTHAVEFASMHMTVD